MIQPQEIAAILVRVAQRQTSLQTLEQPTGYHWRIGVEGYEILIFDDARRLEDDL